MQSKPLLKDIDVLDYRKVFYYLINTPNNIVVLHQALESLS